MPLEQSKIIVRAADWHSTVRLYKSSRSKHDSAYHT